MDKKSFIIHEDSLHVLEKLNMEQRGELFTAIWKFQKGETFTLSPLVDVAFSSFESQFIRDNDKYVKFIEKQSENGKKGGRPQKAKKPKPFLENPTKPKKAYSVSVSDSVSVNDSVNVNENKTDIYSPDFLEFWSAYPNKTGKKSAFDSYVTAVKKGGGLDKILKALSWQIKQEQWVKDDGKYIPHPTTYLNQCRWDDEPPTKKSIPPPIDIFVPDYSKPYKK